MERSGYGSTGLIMRLTSINLGRERTIKGKKRSWTTGIYKFPVETPVQVNPSGLSDDVICDKKNHGGLDQALYVYGTTDYAWWTTFLGRELAPGTFGENLTIDGLESAQFRIGDHLVIAAVILEVTSPRIPCNTLATRMGDPLFVKQFRQAERPGLYCRVIRAGWVESGDSVVLERYPGDTISVIEMFRGYYDPNPDEATLQRYLAAPIATRSRADKEEQLRQLSSKRNED